MQNLRPSILFAICAWSLLILRFGYRYGTGDQVELLPYTLFLHDPSLYPHDFFIHGLNASVPNERTVMACLLLPFVNHLEIFCFIFQFIATVALVMGLERLAGKFIQNKYLVWIAVLGALIPLNDFALGNVEIYSECLQASSVATALIVWALNWFLEKKFIQASILISIGSFIQLLEGLDVMMVLSVILFVSAIKLEIPRKTLITFLSIFALTAGLYLVWVFAVKSGAQSPDCRPIAKADLFKVLFGFRHPHHFIFAQFPKLKMLVFFALTAFALRFYGGRSPVVFQFFVIGLAGIFIYAIATDIFHFIFVANFQFYKLTQWMKFLGVVAAIGLMESKLVSAFTLCCWRFDKAALVVVTVFCWGIVLGFNELLPYHVPYQIFGLKQKDDMLSICEQINQETPKEAIFIQPFDNNELKFYAQRSSFVEFKANVRHKCFVGEWYRRLQMVFGVSADDAVKGFALQQKADEHYYGLTLHELAKLQQEGVTHMLVKKDEPPHAGSLILSNNTYAVYKL